MRRTKDEILDDKEIKKWEDYLRQILKIEFDDIFKSIKIKKELCYWHKIYIELCDAFTKEDTWFPYEYMFWISILWDPIWKYFISYDIFLNLKEASNRLIRWSYKTTEWQKYYSEIKNKNLIERKNVQTTTWKTYPWLR